eukprot:scaffold24279_cov17-Tisochrysis_lutea.AAC.1
MASGHGAASWTDFVGHYVVTFVQHAHAAKAVAAQPGVTWVQHSHAANAVAANAMQEPCQPHAGTLVQCCYAANVA